MSDILFQPMGNPIASGGLDHIADIDPRLTRTHYFDGRLLTAEDLTRDQIYLDQRLRELGRVLGHGIMSGLELSFDRFTGLLTLQPGQALTPAGRVLELGTTLVVNLGDRALISTLNDGNYRRFNRALYAVVLRYVDVATDIAEVFPKDLGAKRGFEYALITESVQMGLVPLPIPLPQQNPLQIRARLMREFLGNEQFGSLIPEDGVALGVLAIQDDAPQWLDAELLRHPLRPEAGLGDLQSDLFRQYEKLLAEIVTMRLSGGLNADFHAADYFSLLPPVGTLPKEALNPMVGRQGYFPEHYQVSIAPIRLSDVDLIQAESLGLPPIDLTNREPVDIMILVPLSNQDYGHYATQLEGEFDPATRRLPQLDLLKLKLYPRHVPDTDSAAWGQIWSRLGDTNPFYLRRPTRAAETAISGIVLALGTSVPEPPEEGTETSPADTGGLLQDEDAIFLEQMSLKTLAKVRPPIDGESSDAFNKLLSNFGDRALIVRQAAGILMRIERQYDSLIWQTLLALADGESMEKLLEGLLGADAEANTPKLVYSLGSDLGLDASLLNQWADLAP
ncbi:MAG: hypothetical protein AB1810_03575 [Pseudomonadota bacterium]